MNKEQIKKRFKKKLFDTDGIIRRAELAWSEYVDNVKEGRSVRFWCSKFFPDKELFAFLLSEVERAMPKTVEIEEDKPEYKDEMYCGWYKCSLCKVSNIFPSAKYCPECGAKIKFLNPKAE